MDNWTTRSFRWFFILSSTCSSFRVDVIMVGLVCFCSCWLRRKFLLNSFLHFIRRHFICVLKQIVFETKKKSRIRFVTDCVPLKNLIPFSGMGSPAAEESWPCEPNCYAVMHSKTTAKLVEEARSVVASSWTTRDARGRIPYKRYKISRTNYRLQDRLTSNLITDWSVLDIIKRMLAKATQVQASRTQGLNWRKHTNYWPF